jgi:NAD(P)-dependent dehydrogenase (short-subunit alcohol dehydrogenase family)
MPDNFGPVTLMTGAGGGLGSVVLPMFLEAGHRVTAVSLDWPEPAVRAHPCITLAADLTDASAAEAVTRKTLDHYGRLDCLVHMVGAWTEGRRIEDTTDEVWDRMINVNLRAAFCMIRAVVRPMRSAGGGRIVIVGSTAAIQPVVTWSAFSAAMGGLGAMVEVAAAELRNDKVTVNLLHPSTIDTPLVRAHYSAAQAVQWVDPHNLGSLMLWLCSPAGRDVSGASIALPGRQTHPTYIWPGVAEAK